MIDNQTDINYFKSPLNGKNGQVAFETKLPDILESHEDAINQSITDIITNSSDITTLKNKVKVYTYETISQAQLDTGLQNGYVDVLGYNEIGDGAKQSFLKINGNLIPVSDIEKNYIDFSWFGGKSDGVFDNTPVFNSILDFTKLDITSQILNNTLTVDSNLNGVADNWNQYLGTGITGNYQNNQEQIINLTNSSQIGGIGISQDILINEGESIKFNIDYKSQVNSGNFQNAIVLQALDSNGSLIYLFGGIFLNNNSTYSTYSSQSFEMPQGTKKLKFLILAYANSIGSTGAGTFKNLKMSKNTKGYKKLFFKQNKTNTANYYFSETPPLSSFVIDSEDNVILNFPTTNNLSFKLTKFLNDIKIYSRDRINTGLQFAENGLNLISSSFTENNKNIGVKKLKKMLDSNINKNIYTANSNVIIPATLTLTNSMYDGALLTNEPSKIVVTEFNSILNNMFYCDFEFLQIETGNIVCGISATKSNGDWWMYYIDKNGSTGGFKNISSSFSNFSTKNINSIITDAYKMKKGIIMSFRPISTDTIEIFINGLYIETVTIPFSFEKVGFGCLKSNSGGFGLSNTTWGRIVYGECLDKNLGDKLRIAVFGDSISFGEGSISWADYLPKLLKGQKGITDVEIINYSASGNTSTQQLAKLQTIDLTSFNYVLILIGTNDIQGLTSYSTFKTNVNTMISLSKSSYRKVILGIPPMFISKDLTNEGAITVNYEKGSLYRSVIMELVADNDIYIADTFSEIGRIGIDNVKSTLRDNLHPNTFGEIMLSRCFSRTIIESI